MSTSMFVKPAPGLRVRRPDKHGEHLPAEGAEVPADAYWYRRLRDGDVRPAQAPQQSASHPAPSPAPKPEKTSAKRGPHKE